MYSEGSFPNSFQTERNTVVVTIFLLITNETDFRLIHNQEENSHYDRIPFDLKGIRKSFL